MRFLADMGVAQRIVDWLRTIVVVEESRHRARRFSYET
jgi:hypothetical protein